MSMYNHYPFLSGQYPLAQVTPFTEREGGTIMSVMESFKRFAQGLGAEVNEVITKHFTEYEAALAEAKGNWQTLFNEFMANVVVELEGLNDQAVANLVNSELSKIRVALNQNFASKGTQTTVEEGRLSAESMNLMREGITDDINTVQDDVNQRVPIFDNRVKIGVTALEDHTDTSRNIVGIGQNAGRNLVDGDKTVIIGTNAMTDGEHSLDNVAIGDGALKATDAISSDYSQSSMEGTRNVGVGGNAGRFNKRGAAHTFVGRNAGQNVVGGQGIVAIGNGAQASRCPVGLSGTVENWAPLAEGNPNAVNIVAVGNWAASRNIALNVTALGSYALTNATKSNANTAVGSNSLRRVDQHKWIDGSALIEKNINGSYDHSGTTLILTVSNHGAAVGDIIIFQLTSGASQTFSNDQVFAHVVAVPGASQVRVAHPVARNTTGTARLVAVVKPSQPVTYSDDNTAIGSASLAFLDESSANTAVGSNAGRNLKKGASNVFIGANSGAGISEAAEITASDNTGVGQGTLYELSDDMTGNTAIGYRAGLNLREGKDNTFIGRLAGAETFQSEPLRNITGSTAIGAGSSISGNNQVQLGNSSTTTYAYGAVQSRSDERDKQAIRDTVLGLEFVNKLRPVDFKYAYRESDTVGERYHHGLIAQDVQKLIEETGIDFGGFQDHKISGGADVLSIGYTELIAPLVKAVQQLTARVEELEKRD